MDFTWKKKKDLFRFTAILDDRGRVVIPASIRNKFKLKFNSKIILQLKAYGRSSTMVSVDACGASEAGSIPACGPNNKRGVEDE